MQCASMRVRVCVCVLRVSVMAYRSSPAEVAGLGAVDQNNGEPIKGALHLTGDT